MYDMDRHGHGNNNNSNIINHSHSNITTPINSPHSNHIALNNPNINASPHPRINLEAISVADPSSEIDIRDVRSLDITFHNEDGIPISRVVATADGRCHWFFITSPEGCSPDDWTYRSWDSDDDDDDFKFSPNMPGCGFFRFTNYYITLPDNNNNNSTSSSTNDNNTTNKNHALNIL
eukprot:2040_1